MIETFDYASIAASGWNNVAVLVANQNINTSDQLQGSGCLEWDKTGTSGTNSYCGRRLRVPFDLADFIDGGYSLTFSVYHADFASFASIGVGFVYKFNEAGGGLTADAEFNVLFQDASGLTGAAWNTVTISLRDLLALTAPTVGTRRRVVGLVCWAVMDNAADTFTDLRFDAIRFTGKQSAALLWDGKRLPIPALNPWEPTPQEERHVNRTPLSVDLWQLARKEGIRFGHQQVRNVHHQDSDLHTLENSLELFDQYSLAGKGWGVAYPANELIDTTLSAAASAGDRTISLNSTTDLAFLGDVADVRIGPNDSRQVIRNRITSRSGSTARLAYPLAYPLESGTPVRSLGYWPSLYRDGGQALTRRNAAALSVLGVETL